MLSESVDAICPDFSVTHDCAWVRIACDSKDVGAQASRVYLGTGES